MAQSVTACPLASLYPAPAPNRPGAGREALDVAFGAPVVPGPDVAAPWRPRPPDWDCSHSLLPRPRVPAGSLLTEAPSVALPLLLCPCVLRLSISLSLYLLLPGCLCPSLCHRFPKGLPAQEPSASPGEHLGNGYFLGQHPRLAAMGEGKVAPPSPPFLGNSGPWGLQGRHLGAHGVIPGSGHMLHVMGPSESPELLGPCLHLRNGGWGLESPPQA